MSGFSACPMCGQSIHAHDPDVCRRRWQADTVAAAERFAAEQERPLALRMGSCPKCGCPIPDGYAVRDGECPFHLGIPSEAYSGTPHVTKPRPFAKTYDCEAADTDAGHVVVALALSARDAANLRALASGAAIITGEVTIEATESGFVVQLDSYTVFA